jgi:cytochrome c oxidase subunit IV
MTNHAIAAPAASAADQPPEWVHVVPLPVLLAVFAALMVLTVVTVVVAAAPFDLGPWSLWIAMGIATLKAGLVALYFMHLRYDHPFNALIFLVALVLLTIFVSLTLLDTLQYQGDIRRQQESVQKSAYPPPAP